MENKWASAEISKENENHVIWNLRKGDPYYYKMADNLAKLGSTIGRNAELVSNEPRYIVKEISKQNVRDMAWFPFAAVYMRSWDPRWKF